jgi:septal ring factor EnvC (AmiA/AmiB activator)
VASAQEQEATEGELEKLKTAITSLELEQSRQIDRRDDGMAELRSIELALAESRQALVDIDESIETQTARLAEIAAEQSDASGRLADEQDALAEQVRMSYMSGSQELIRLLLSQDNPADFGRMLVYYDYLNRHRAVRIAIVDTELERLRRLARENVAVRDELESLRSDQAARSRQLEEQQRERRDLVATLDAAIEASGSRIEQMRAEEAELTEILTRLSQLLEGFPVNSDAPFVAQKGALVLPVRGEIVARFGDPRDATGQIRWTGMVLAAEAGTPVQAVYQGQVAVAQWHSHMGLLVIIDHGDGYMSLYGHNRAVLRQSGDRVRAGDVIAEVGNTGGRADPALFFSIVHEAAAQDPEDWLR